MAGHRQILFSPRRNHSISKTNVRPSARPQPKMKEDNKKLLFQHYRGKRNHVKQNRLRPLQGTAECIHWNGGLIGKKKWCAESIWEVDPCAPQNPPPMSNTRRGNPSAAAVSHAIRALRIAAAKQGGKGVKWQEPPGERCGLKAVANLKKRWPLGAPCFL